MYNLQQGEMKLRRWQGQEFPDFHTIIIERSGAANSEPGMNRKQRRARSARPASKGRR